MPRHDSVTPSAGTGKKYSPLNREPRQLNAPSSSDTLSRDGTSNHRGPAGIDIARDIVVNANDQAR